MRILTNVGIEPHWRSSSGVAGEAVVAHTFRGAVRHLPSCDLILINGNPRLLLRLIALQCLVPWLRRINVGADIVLRVPESRWERLVHPVARFLLGRVDYFLHHFRDLRGYRRYFGIGPNRSGFLAFKPNLRGHTEVAPNPEGEYVLCLGRSMRDFDSFLDAMEGLPYPGAIAEPDLPRLRANGSKFSRRLDRLPANIRLLKHDPDDYGSQVEILMGAKLVVVPLRKNCIVMSGTPYNAMLLGKCVLLTAGTASNGLFRDEVLPMPAEDPAGIAAAIDHAWQDDELRRRTAAKGYRLACSLGGLAEYRQRHLDLTVAWLQSHDTQPATESTPLAGRSPVDPERKCRRNSAPGLAGWRERPAAVASSSRRR